MDMDMDMDMDMHMVCITDRRGYISLRELDAPLAVRD